MAAALEEKQPVIDGDYLNYLSRATSQPDLAGRRLSRSASCSLWSVRPRRKKKLI